MNKEIIEDIVEWDVVNWSHALTFWDQHLKDAKGLKCLELGGRRGGPSLWLALKGGIVHCTDLENPEEHARTLHSRYTLDSPITYEGISALEVPYTEAFDIVIFKSILGGISRDGRNERKQQVIDECFKALKPGGRLFFAENMESSALHRFARKRFVKWGGEWNYLRYNELDDLFRSFASVQYKTHGFFGAFGRSEKQRRFLGRVDGVVQVLIPRSKRYIVFGVATKK